MNFITNPTMSLTVDECKRFEKQGWIGPFSLIDDNFINATLDEFHLRKSEFYWPNVKDEYAYDKSGKLLWFKSLHCHLSRVFEIVTHPKLIKMLTVLHGKRIMAWGATITTRHPGQAHRWHGDIEHYKWTGLSVFLGLRNASSMACMKVIPGSQNWGVTPQELGELSEPELLAKAQQFDPEASIVQIPCDEGDYFIFSGRLWHASENTSQKTRTALIAQYSGTDEIVLIPPSYRTPICWDDMLRPECIIIDKI